MALIQRNRRAGLTTGPNVGSLQDQANHTGEGKDKLYRSMKRFEALGRATLASIVGTSLDTGVELDALVKQPKEIQRQLVNRTAAGELVSAKQVLGEMRQIGLETHQMEPDREDADQRGPDQRASYQKAPDQRRPDQRATDQKEPDQKEPDQREPDHPYAYEAWVGLSNWISKYRDLLQSKGLAREVNELYRAFCNAVYRPDEEDAEGHTSQHPKKGWFDWFKLD
jgi:hypothetical protein